MLMIYDGMSLTNSDTLSGSVGLHWIEWSRWQHRCALRDVMGVLGFVAASETYYSWQLP